MSLTAVADDRHLLRADEVEVAVAVVVDRCHIGNCASFSSRVQTWVVASGQHDDENQVTGRN
jgi:hypothetical protein